MRLRCFIWGHAAHSPTIAVDACRVCHSVDDYYGSGEQWTEFERKGLIGEARDYWYHLTFPIRKHFALRCDHCNAWIGLKRRHGRFCNRTCAEQWSPF